MREAYNRQSDSLGFNKVQLTPRNIRNEVFKFYRPPCSGVSEAKRAQRTGGRLSGKNGRASSVGTIAAAKLFPL